MRNSATWLSSRAYLCLPREQTPHYHPNQPSAVRASLASRSSQRNMSWLALETMRRNSTNNYSGPFCMILSDTFFIRTISINTISHINRDYPESQVKIFNMRNACIFHKFNKLLPFWECHH